MFGLGMGELVIIFLIILFIFGAGKIPKIAKDIGSGIRELKKGFDGSYDKEEKDQKNEKK